MGMRHGNYVQDAVQEGDMSWHFHLVTWNYTSHRNSVLKSNGQFSSHSFLAMYLVNWMSCTDFQNSQIAFHPPKSLNCFQYNLEDSEFCLSLTGLKCSHPLNPGGHFSWIAFVSIPTLFSLLIAFYLERWYSIVFNSHSCFLYV